MTTEFGILLYDIHLEYVSPDIKLVNTTMVITKDGKDTFIDIIAWNKNAEILNTSFKKGELIYLDGHLINVTRVKDNAKFDTIALEIDDIKFPYLEFKKTTNIIKSIYKKVPDFLE